MREVGARQAIEDEEAHLRQLQAQVQVGLGVVMGRVLVMDCGHPNCAGCPVSHNLAYCLCVRMHKGCLLQACAHPPVIWYLMALRLDL